MIRSDIVQSYSYACQINSRFELSARDARAAADASLSKLRMFSNSKKTHKLLLQLLSQSLKFQKW